MTNALRLGRPALLEAVDHLLDVIDQDVAADFARQGDQWQTKCDAIQAGAAETQKRLESEIRGLREQVAALTGALEKEKAQAQARAQTSRQTEGAAEAGDEQDSGLPALDAADLQRRLDKSLTRYESVKAQLDSAVSIAQKRKAEILKWVNYADSLELKIKWLEKKKKTGSTATPAPAGSSARQPEASIAHAGPLTPATTEKPAAVVEKPSLSASFSSAMSFTGNPPTDEAGAEPACATAVGDSMDGSTDSAADEAGLESTQGEPSSSQASSLPKLPTPRATDPSSNATGRAVQIKTEPSSDGPEVVWERPVKRPRRDGVSPQTEEQAHALPTKPVVKRESSDNMPASTPPTNRATATSWKTIPSYRASQESVDLDEGQLTVPTPRKRQLFLQLASDDDARHAASEQDRTRPTPAPAPAPSPAPARSTPLAPLSPNVRRAVRDPESALRLLKRRVGELADDGDEHYSDSRTPARSTVEPPLSAARASRLSSLLHARPAEPSPVSVSSLARSSATGSQFGLPPPPRRLPPLRGSGGEHGVSTPTPAARGRTAAESEAGGPLRSGASTPTPTSAHTPQQRPSPLTAALLAAKAQSTAAKKAAGSASFSSSSSLRGRPVEQLRPDDFKINPAANNGETFAYSEVVRSRADRTGLAGCTDPQCCGQAFRGMATSELDAAGPAHVNRPDSVVLMERHLGDDAPRLARMAPEERRALWIEARTRELADKYGKHRHRFHRRASPPGFWDTDFPTTQEEERLRGEAERVERAAVLERYREAMRPGGRWLFRDEEADAA